jgi:hypothetical protein
MSSSFLLTLDRERTATRDSDIFLLGWVKVQASFRTQHGLPGEDSAR